MRKETQLGTTHFTGSSLERVHPRVPVREECRDCASQRGVLGFVQP